MGGANFFNDLTQAATPEKLEITDASNLETSRSFEIHKNVRNRSLKTSKQRADKIKEGNFK